jgi:hypothetical protein
MDGDPSLNVDSKSAMHTPSLDPTSQAKWPKRTRLVRACIWALLLALMFLIFDLYTHPEFVMNVANQVWSCF